MPRVLLIRPLCEGDEPEFAEPLGIERLAGYLRAHGIDDVTVLDRRLYQLEQRAGTSRGSFWGDVRTRFGAVPPDVVGLSLMTASDVPDGLRILSRIRSWWPRTRLAAGGLFVTSCADEAERRLPKVVTLLSGEGELALLAFARNDPPPAQAIPSPDDWAPAYRPVVERYAALGCAVNMQTSRGCPGACAFCATPRLPASLRVWQPRDLGLVVDEVQHEAARLQAAGLPPIFNFVDDDFGPLTRIEALARELGRRHLRIAFALEMRLASLIGQDRLASRLACLHEMGLARVFVGVESLDPRTLRRWHKPYDLAALPDVLDALSQAGVSVQAGYILWHRDQTVAGALEEVEGLRQLGLYSHRAALSRLIVFAGCALAQDPCDEQGYQRMAPEAEAFYRRFAEESAELAPAWAQAAIAEPHAAAQALLTGDDARLVSIRSELAGVNERSYELFRRLVP